MISSTSSSSRDPELVWPRVRRWVVAACVGVLLGLGLYWITQGHDRGAELRVAASNRALSVLIADGEQRVLVLNATGPQDARAVIGLLVQPWERDPSTLIVSADQDNEEAIWEALQRLSLQQAIVVGAPGADPDWIEIERYCRDNGIELSYVGVSTTVQMTRFLLTIEPPGPTTGSFLELDHGSVRALIELSGRPAFGRYHVSVSDSPRGSPVWTDLQIAGADSRSMERASMIVLQSGDRVDLAFEDDRISVRGRAAETLKSR